jgi:hypothetical protein
MKSQVEVHPFCQHIGTYHRKLTFGIQYSSIVANAFQGLFRMVNGNRLLYLFNETEFAKFAEFGTAGGVFKHGAKVGFREMANRESLCAGG